MFEYLGRRAWVPCEAGWESEMLALRDAENNRSSHPVLSMDIALAIRQASSGLAREAERCQDMSSPASVGPPFSRSIHQLLITVDSLHPICFPHNAKITCHMFFGHLQSGTREGEHGPAGLEGLSRTRGVKSEPTTSPLFLYLGPDLVTGYLGEETVRRLPYRKQCRLR